jgi:ubiquitin-conjugating enzyme E2 Z
MHMGTVDFLHKDTIRRIAKDVSNIYKSPLDKEGIYYVHNDDDMLKGYAMIIGPKDTLYTNGMYLFEFHFPNNYPYRPPKVIMKTNNGIYRMHPNLYRNGKVCLSILNTWKGESWTSCQTIRSILMTIVTIFDKMPLLHEPGIKDGHQDIPKYNMIIEYANIHLAYLQIGSPGYMLGPFQVFESFIRNHIDETIDDVITYVKQIKTVRPLSMIQTSIYEMVVNIHYDELLTKLIELKGDKKSSIVT